ncbi:hypothetical protein AAG906_014863 [Vitis piasezkii]
MSYEIDKELNGDSMLMHKSTHIHCELVETLTVDGENGLRYQNESLEGYKDYRKDTNPTNDKQATQIGSFRTGSAQSAEILTIIDTNDGFIHDNPTIIEISGISDDHLEEHQIYSSKKELQRKLYMMALKRKFEFKTTKSTTKLLLWQVRATKLGISNMLQIMKYYSTHTCRLDMMSCDNQHASSWLIGENIIADIRKQYVVQISYDKVQRVRELALGSIRVSPKESYNTLSSYCYVLEQKNLGTITDIVTDCDNQFKYFFMPIGTSLVGFHTSIRHVVAVDGTFCKAKYLGTLFIVWFSQKLRDTIGHIDDWFVISDRHGIIEKVVHKVFPHARHGVCTYRVGQNLKTKFKKLITHKLYNIMTTGIFESLNVVLKNARDLSILQLVEELRNLLQKWFVTRQQQEMSMSIELTMLVDGELRSRYNMSTTYLVEPINSKECNVKYAGISAQVNLDTRSCTCRQFDLDHIPCAHVIATCRFYNISCYTLCSQYFTTKALLSSYSKCIYPTGNELDWVIPDHIRNKIVKTRKVRIPSGEESKRTSCCSRCGQYGHNRKTCKRPIP